MTKPFKKERLGEVQGSLGPPRASDLIHSPEEIAKQQALADQISAQIYSQLQQNFYNFVDESSEISYGDMVTFVTNIINNYLLHELRIIGTYLDAGRGIAIMQAGVTGFISVDFTDNKGLKFTGTGKTSKLEVDYNTALGVDCDASGLKVIPDTARGIGVDGSGVYIDTSDSGILTGDESGDSNVSGLDFESNGVRVAPCDFLYTELDV